MTPPRPSLSQHQISEPVALTDAALHQQHLASSSSSTTATTQERCQPSRLTAMGERQADAPHADDVDEDAVVHVAPERSTRRCPTML